MGNSECRIVGISRSSGTRWRHGHTVVLKSGDVKKIAPISRLRPAAISARFLSESERITIADLLHAGRSIRAIALELGRSPSTVSREIRRTFTNPLATIVRGQHSAAPNVDGAASGPAR
ncbi:helix-turn-helix domain-containing protein [Arthrobacter oryzae]|uniref:helix-turn-helix domain-containing protein n=1 Tax=Arthrobacter oryzae TaxID=409290 RepID=UPI0037BF6354